MKWIVPDFYRDFRCIGGKCIDNCCIGWEIDIDEDTAEHYKTVTSELGKRLKNCISWEETPHFILGKDERCPFLNPQNLCDIQGALGEQSLCEICREHPRFHEWFGAFRESGIGLCCPEAARLLLKEETPMRFVELDDGMPEEDFEDEYALSFVLEARQTLYSILQDRSVPFPARLTRFYNTACSFQAELDGALPDTEMLSLPTDEMLLDYAKSLEPINNDWTELLIKAEQAECTSPSLPDWVQEKAAMYLSFRWLGKAVYDYDLFGKAEFIVRFMGLLNLLIQQNCVANAEEGLRILSKEMEYLA